MSYYDSNMNIEIDYVKLEENLRKTLNILAHLRIDSSNVELEKNAGCTSGGFGDVYRGVLVRDAERPSIALKKLRPFGDRDDRLRVAAALVREIKVWEGLAHENILKLQAFQLDHTEFRSASIVTLWQDHGCIMAYIKVEKPSMDRRMELVTDTARGLEYLHGLSPSVCHCDIKAANTLVNKEGKAVLCDFGLARVLEEVPTGLTTSGTKTGTTRYLSPELFAEDPAHTCESDVWAWGCLALEITSDQRPYHSVRTTATVTLHIAQGKIPADIDAMVVPDIVKSILRKCWVSNPLARPAMSWIYASLIPPTVSGPEEEHLSHNIDTDPPLSNSLETYLLEQETGSPRVYPVQPSRRSRARLNHALTMGDIEIAAGALPRRFPPETRRLPETEGITEAGRFLRSLEGILRDTTQLAHALRVCDTALTSKEPRMETAITEVLERYPRCIRNRQALCNSSYDEQAKLCIDGTELLGKVRSTLRDVVFQYTALSTLDAPSIPDTDREEDPTDFVLALQLKACMLNQRRETALPVTISARENATTLFQDISAAANLVDPVIPCRDIVSNCDKLVHAIRRDSTWPEPYMGRECTADLCIRLAHTVFSSVALGTIEDNSEAEIGHIRSIVNDFFAHDAEQVTPLLPVRRVEVSPATTVESLEFTSSAMRPSKIAQWYFRNPNLCSEVEVTSRFAVEEGGFAGVYKGKWMNHDVAIKRLNRNSDPESALRKIRRESQFWSGLYHENIVPFFGSAEWAGADVLISPWIPHKNAYHSFNQRFEKVEPVLLTQDDIATRLKFIIQVAHALCYLHKRGVVHGDIRLANILVSSGGDALLTDFGLAKFMEAEFEEVPSTAFQRSGTTQWKAPELLDYKGAAPSRSEKSDVWAFACTGLELFSGKIPYDTIPQHEVAPKVSSGIPPPISATARTSVPRLWAILEACWTKNPKERPRMDVMFMSLMMMRTHRKYLVSAVMQD